MPSVRIKRGTRAQLDAAASASGLVVGEPYYITDEDRMAIGTSASTYQAAAKHGEGGSFQVLTGTGLPPSPAGYADGTFYIRQITSGAVSKADFLRYAFLLSPNNLPPATDGFFTPGSTNYDTYMVAAGVAGHYALTGFFAANGTMYGSPAAPNGKVRIGSSVWQRIVQHALPSEAAFTDLIGQGQTVVLLHNVVRSTVADAYASVARNGYTSAASSAGGHLTVGAITYYSATDQKIYHGKLDSWQEVALPEIVERYILADGEWQPLTGAEGPQGVQGVQGVPGPGHGGCRLDYVSPTQITLWPVGTGQMAYPGGASSPIPAVGVSASNSGLSAETLYYVYLTSDLQLEVVTTAPEWVGGYRVKSGNASKTLVGMVRTNASGQFQSSDAYIGVLSWFNRRPLRGTASLSASRSTTSNTPVSMCTAAELVYFLSWGDDVACAGCNGNGANTTTTDGVWFGLGVDGVLSSPLFGVYPVASSKYCGMSIPAIPVPVSEGWHSVGIMGRVSNTGNLTLLGNDAQFGAKTHVCVEG